MTTLKVTVKNVEDQRHSGSVQTLLFHDGKLFSGGEDGKIKAYDTYEVRLITHFDDISVNSPQVWKDNLELLGEIKAHDNCVYSLAAIGNKLYSSSNDGTIKIWFIDSLKAKGTLRTGDTEVNKMIVNNGRLYAGDEKGAVLIYENDQTLNVLHVVEEVLSLDVKDQFLFTTRSLDVTVTEINSANDGKFKITASVEGKSPLKVIGDRLAVCTRDGKNVKVHRISSTGTLQMWCTITGSELIIQDLAAVEYNNQLVLFSGGYDKIIKRWIISGDKPLPGGCAIVPTVINAISAGASGQVYVGGEDGLICRLDLS